MAENEIQHGQTLQPLPPVIPGEQYLVLQWLDPTQRRNSHPLHNTNARRPTTQQEMDEWPAAIIVDFMYACAVIRRWGTPALRSSLQRHHIRNNPATWARDAREWEEDENAERRRTATHERAERAAQRLARLDGPSKAQENAEDANATEGWTWYMDGLLEFQLMRQRERGLAQVRRKATAWLNDIEHESYLAPGMPAPL